VEKAKKPADAKKQKICLIDMKSEAAGGIGLALKGMLLELRHY
jgi:hypothetical protein